MLRWAEFMQQARDQLIELDAAGCNDPWFRGHSDQEWVLLPSLAREQSNSRFNYNTEKRLFWDFRMLGSHLIPSGGSHWTTLFYMQHHGLPTRLLDWTTSFATSLFFATKGQAASPTIWILNPYRLAQEFTGHPSISNLNVSFKMDYDQVMECGISPNAAFSVTGDSSLGRIRSQGGMFTFHVNLTTPIEILCPPAVHKLVLDPRDMEDARSFLQMASVTDFSIFPDLDGLARYLCRKELGRQE